MPRINPPPPVAAVFGQRVREHREAAGLSQIDLAERCGLHFTYCSSVERGRRNPTLTSILRLAEGLDIDPGELIAGLSDTRR